MLAEVPLYEGAGFAFFPTEPGWKRPLRAIGTGDAAWNKYRTEKASHDEWETWERSYPGLGIGIICGTPSNGLIALDIDHAGLSAWIEQYLSEILQKTWTVKTGSGKIHIYFRSTVPVYSSALKAAGKTIGDLRGYANENRTVGGYVCAPPTYAQFQQHPAPYKTLYGSPETVRTVDMVPLLEKLLDGFGRYFQSAPTSSISVPSVNGTGPVTLRGAATTVPALKDADKLALQDRLQIGRPIAERFYRAIIHGGEPGMRPWEHSRSYSEIDFSVCRELVDEGYSDAEIEQIFSTFVIGEKTYRNQERTNHGASYLQTTIQRARDLVNPGPHAPTETPSGRNFTIHRVLRIEYEKPAYQLDIEFNGSGVIQQATIDTIALLNPASFQEQILRSTGHIPELHARHETRKGYATLGANITKSSEVEAIPTSGTYTGQLKNLLLSTIRRELRDEWPQEYADMRLGWKSNGTQKIYLLPLQILTSVGSMLRPQPRADQLWEVLRSLRGFEENIELSDGHVERVWVLSFPKIHE